MKAFVRYDVGGRVVPSSLIVMESKPANGDWVEVPIFDNATSPVYKTNHLRAFIRYDRRGYAIPGSLIISKICPDIKHWREINLKKVKKKTTTTTTTTVEIITTTTTTTIDERCIKFGYYYNSYAFRNVKNIANTGWKLPTPAQLVSLANVYGIPYTGKYMKEVNPDYWDDISHSSNTLKMNMRGCGYVFVYRFVPQFCVSLLVKQRMYVVTDAAPVGGSIIAFVLNYDSDSFSQTSVYEGSGFYSIRLVKESTDLSNGETGIYIGNDGREYPTICVNNVEWMAIDLLETKYRDGTPISRRNSCPEALANALDEGYLCYNFDETYALDECSTYTTTTTTTTFPPWNYEGTMTAGQSGSARGFNIDFGIGSVDPSPAINGSFGEILYIFSSGTTGRAFVRNDVPAKGANYISIDDTIYSVDSTGKIDVDPFTVQFQNGITYNIKLN